MCNKYNSSPWLFWTLLQLFSVINCVLTKNVLLPAQNSQLDLETSAAEPRPVIIDIAKHPVIQSLPLVYEAGTPITDASEKVEKILHRPLAFSYNKPQKDQASDDTIVEYFGKVKYEDDPDKGNLAVTGEDNQDNSQPAADQPVVERKQFKRRKNTDYVSRGRLYTGNQWKSTDNDDDDDDSKSAANYEVKEEQPLEDKIAEEEKAEEEKAKLANRGPQVYDNSAKTGNDAGANYDTVVSVPEAYNNDHASIELIDGESNYAAKIQEKPHKGELLQTAADDSHHHHGHDHHHHHHEHKHHDHGHKHHDHGHKHHDDGHKHHDHGHKHHDHGHKDGGHKDGGHKDHKHEKGGGKEHHADHHSHHGEKGEKEYDGDHKYEKQDHGKHDKEAHKGKYKDHGEHEEEHHEEHGHFGKHEEGEEGKKGSEYDEEGEHNKGHSTKGEHNVYKKDEYEKKHEFYDEDHEGGEHEKHGGFDDEHDYEKGGHEKEEHKHGGHHEEGHGEKEHHEKGHHHHEDKGHKDGEGKHHHHHHEEKHGEKKEGGDGKKHHYKKSSGDDGGGHDKGHHDHGHKHHDHGHKHHHHDHGHKHHDHGHKHHHHHHGHHHDGHAAGSQAHGKIVKNHVKAAPKPIVVKEDSQSGSTQPVGVRRIKDNIDGLYTIRIPGVNYNTPVTSNPYPEQSVNRPKKIASHGSYKIGGDYGGYETGSHTNTKPSTIAPITKNRLRGQHEYAESIRRKDDNVDNYRSPSTDYDTYNKNEDVVGNVPIREPTREPRRRYIADTFMGPDSYKFASEPKPIKEIKDRIIKETKIHGNDEPSKVLTTEASQQITNTAKKILDEPLITESTQFQSTPKATDVLEENIGDESYHSAVYKDISPVALRGLDYAVFEKAKIGSGGGHYGGQLKAAASTSGCGEGTEEKAAESSQVAFDEIAVSSNDNAKVVKP